MNVENNDFEQMSLFEEDDGQPKSNDELKEAVEEQLSKIRNQSMVVGFRVACQTVLDKISAFERSPGTKSNNDHKRLIKEIKKFVETALSDKISDNEVSENSTKLMEDN